MKRILYISLICMGSAFAFPPTTHGIWASQRAQCDPDALAYINAAGITDAAEKVAVCNLTTSLKSYGLWTKMRTIYPFLGSTSTTCKYNLKSPYDADTSYRLSFLVGGWSFSSMGADPNGTTGYADTHLNPSTVGSSSSFSFGIYSRTASTTGTQVYGCNESGYICQNNITSANGIIGDNPGTAISYTASPTTRFIMWRRNSTTDFQGYRDGTSLGTNSTAATGITNRNFFLGARHDPTGPIFYSTHELAFAFIGIGLTNQEALDLTTIVNTFVTALARNV